MKVYSQPEVLEDHIAPAALITNSFTDAGLAPGSEANASSFADSFDPAAPTEPVTIGGDFDIQTVAIGTNGSPISNPELIDFNATVLQSLIGNVEIGTESSDVTFTRLADVLGVQNDILEPIESAVGEDRSIALVGLSSKEFERSGGAAFLTSL
ncbi:MAG TPA: hypothetical protein VFG14_11405 [Chthoniobacteraceae bacterium]|nr:hypothetical protein [Chthoniobacteraceae bacterium]